jgi:hypothetical protein
MRRLALIVAAAAAFAACSEDVSYQPAPQILPANIQKLGLAQVINKTQQFGLEDKLGLAIRDQFLADGRYPLVPVEDCNGIVQVTVTRYLLTPIQYDATLNPTSFKMRMSIEVSVIDKTTNTALWDERNLEGVLVYPISTLAGGLTEEQAREQIYPIVATKVVKRVIDGFGAVGHTTERRVSSDAPSTEPAAQPVTPLAPVLPAPY